MISRNLSIGLLCVFAVSAQANDWPQFRGPTGDGIGTAQNLPVKWSESKNIAWKCKVDGIGWSSPVVVDNEIWITSAVAEELSEDERAEKLKSAPIQGLNAYKKVNLFAAKIDLVSGKVIKQVKVFELNDPPLIHSLNSFASPTAVIDGDNVIVNFGSYGTASLDRESYEINWKRNNIKVEHETGPGSSPVLWKDLVIIHFDGTDQQFVTALDAKSGKTKWQTKRSGELHKDPSLQKAFGTPTIAEQHGQDVLISPGANWVYAYDPATGKELWKTSYGKLGFSCVPRPIVAGNMLYVCTSYMRSSLLALDLAAGNTMDFESAPIKWQYNNQVPNMSSPILVDGKLYFCSDRGIASCIDAESGENVWTQRLNGAVSASPVFADGKIFMSNREGQTFVIEPGSEFKKLATNKLDSRIMGSPAVTKDSLIIRTENFLYRIKKKD